MSKIKTIKKIPMEVIRLLAQNQEIVKLLVNDAPSALSDPAPSYTLNQLIEDRYISAFPPTESSIEQWGRNTFLTVLLDAVSLHNINDNSHINLVLYVSTDVSTLVLDDNKNRLLELADRIVDTLDNAKTSVAGSLIVNSMDHVLLSNFHSAYAIHIVCYEQETRKAEI